MTPDLDRLESLHAAATKGPWEAADWTQDDGPNAYTIEAMGAASDHWPGGISKIRVAELEECDNRDNDIALIVEAVNALPELISEIRGLREALEPFAQLADLLADGVHEQRHFVSGLTGDYHVTTGELRRARQALTGGTD